jgi:hypothetical protein
VWGSGLKFICYNKKMRKILLVLIVLSLTSNATAMAKTIVWQCQVVQVNDKKQTNGKTNQYKIDVTTPMVWFGNETRWAGFVNTKYKYDQNNHILYSISKPWDGVYDLAALTIIFTNRDANLKISYKCEELN